MSTDQEIIRAAIDIGSNSAKMTIARVLDNSIEIIAHESAMLRLGESVNATGDISPAKQEALITTLQKYQRLAWKYKSSAITTVATEAVRKAHNHTDVLNAIQEQTGLLVQLLSGEIEASLTYLGVTSDNQMTFNAGVVDIGGGSSELIIAQQGHIRWLTSLPIGSGWIQDRYLTSNPPASAEIEEARAFLNAYFRRVQLPQMPTMLVATGSSARVLLSLVKQALKVAAERHTLSRNDLLGTLGLLSALPVEDLAIRYEVPVERARVLPGGALILLALLDFLQLEAISVSQRGLSEGTLLASLKYGDNWIEHPAIKVPSSDIGKAPARVVSDDTDTGDESTASTTTGSSHNETFAASGRRELQQRARKFVKWIDPVLENDDVESVHKMRVASRRLRATFDAYESACAPKPFKRVYREVKQAADVLGMARDTDVMLQHIEQQQKQVSDTEMAGLQWLTRRLQTYREQQQLEIESFFEDFHTTVFKRSISSCIPEGESKHGKS